MQILVTGAHGMLGKSLCEVLAEKHTVIGMGHDDFDVTDSNAWRSILTFQRKPDLIVHCAAFTQVDAAEHEEHRKVLWETNVEAIQALCDMCLSLGIRVVYPQTFLVLRDQPEAHAPDSEAIEPLGWYAKSKWQAEEVLRRRLPPDLRMTVRLGGFFGGGPESDKNFVGLFLKRILPEALRNGRAYIDIGDRVWQPTWTRDVADVFSWCLERPWREFYQYATQDFVSFADLAQSIVNILGITDIKISRVPAHTVSSLAPRPQRIIMQSTNELVQANFVHTYQVRLQEYLSKYWPDYKPMDFLKGHH